jgi:hypothetical protein
MAEALGRLARVSLAQGEVDRAAGFLSAAMNSSSSAAMQDVVVATSAALRNRVGDHRFNELLAETNTVELGSLLGQDFDENGNPPLPGRLTASPT